MLAWSVPGCHSLPHHPPPPSATALPPAACLLFSLAFLPLLEIDLLFVFVRCYYKILPHMASSGFLICAVLPGFLFGVASSQAP